MFGLNSEDELSDDEPAPEPSKKRSREASGEKKTKKTKLSSLPVFASVDDYSQYLDSEDDE
jgi:ribosome biogenesis protein MAK21